MKVDEFNRIVIIGNGFDLALGLKTSYSEFILWYIRKKIIEELYQKNYSQELINFDEIEQDLLDNIESFKLDINKIKGIKDLLNALSKKSKYTINNDFFKLLINKYENENWIDLEQFYYENLKQIFYKINGDKEIFKKELKAINTCIDIFTNELYEYIKGQQNDERINISRPSMNRLLEKCIEPIRIDRLELIERENINKGPNKVLFLNFNYTDTLKKSLIDARVGGKYSIISIHGNVLDPKNKIIFGYGDDTGDEYKDIENANNKELLIKIKSFQYGFNNNYHRLLSFMENDLYEVFIVGHSCGLSDRTLLKSIFEHKNCILIDVFHYNGIEEYKDKYIEISRHFSNKVKMRKIVMPFFEFNEIPQT
jgi:hypothetical protein